jgi:hypothetical protein
MCNFAFLFRILLAVSVILPFADAIAQTSPAPAQASPSAAPSRDVTGRCDFRMETGPGSHCAGGTLAVSPWRGVYRHCDGAGQERAACPYAHARGERIAMTVDTPEGAVTFDGTLNANGQSLQGTLIYHHGEKFPFSADKRPPAP